MSTKPTWNTKRTDCQVNNARHYKKKTTEIVAVPVMPKHKTIQLKQNEQKNKTDTSSEHQNMRRKKTPTYIFKKKRKEKKVSVRYARYAVAPSYTGGGLVHLLHGEHPGLPPGFVDHFPGVLVLVLGSVVLSLLAPSLLLAGHPRGRLGKIHLRARKTQNIFFFFSKRLFFFLTMVGSQMIGHCANTRK